MIGSDEEQETQSFGGGGQEREEGVSVGIATLDAHALGLVERAQLDAQVATAKAYPRDVTAALRRAESLACMDPTTAGGMFYSRKISGEVVVGPSVRLAEVVAGSWGNLRVDAGVESVDRTHLTAVATVHDLETNTAVRVRVQQRITKRDGSRYGDDMLVTAGNAATSKALRNGVFRVVPRVFVDRLWKLAAQAATGKGTLQEKRERAREHFGKLGVSEAELFAFVGVRGWDGVDLERIIQLGGAANSIRDGEATVEELFRPEQPSTGARDLNASLQAEAAKAAPRARPKGKAERPAAPPAEDPNAPMSEGELANLDGALVHAAEAGVLEPAESVELEQLQAAGKWAELRERARDLERRVLLQQDGRGAQGGGQ